MCAAENGSPFTVVTEYDAGGHLYFCRNLDAQQQHVNYTIASKKRIQTKGT